MGKGIRTGNPHAGDTDSRGQALKTHKQHQDIGYIQSVH